MIKKIIVLLLVFSSSFILIQIIKKKNNSFNQTPNVVFSSNTYDFGKLSKNEKVSYNFIFKNNSKTNIEIKDIIKDCGCVQPIWSKKVIKLLDSDTIVVKFNSTSYGKFSQNFYVYYKQFKKPKQLNITGEVLK